jgi:hypothetical protein
MSNCLEISCLKRWNLKENTKEREKYKKKCEYVSVNDLHL